MFANNIAYEIITILENAMGSLEKEKIFEAVKNLPSELYKFEFVSPDKEFFYDFKIKSKIYQAVNTYYQNPNQETVKEVIQIAVELRSIEAIKR